MLCLTTSNVLILLNEGWPCSEVPCQLVMSFDRVLRGAHHNSSWNNPKVRVNTFKYSFSICSFFRMRAAMLLLVITLIAVESVAGGKNKKGRILSLSLCFSCYNILVFACSCKYWLLKPKSHWTSDTDTNNRSVTHRSIVITFHNSHVKIWHVQKCADHSRHIVSNLL